MMKTLQYASRATLALVLAIGLNAACLAAAPSAHDPQYQNREVWPEDVAATAYSKQEWPRVRLLVWVAEGDYSGSVNDLANWREFEAGADASNPKSGKVPATPPDENTDVLFPDVAGKTDLKVPDKLKMRHVTIGKNVALEFSLVPGFEPSGNVWVRAGGGLDVRTPYYVGAGDAFMRNEEGNARIMHKMPQFNKTGDASIEVLGEWGNRDGLKVNSGKMILGPDSSFHAGNRHPNDVSPKAELILMSGATFQCWKIRSKNSDLDVYGKLIAGTPERPLTKDAHLLLSPGGERFLGGFSLDLTSAASLEVYSADPAKARLVVDLHPEAKKGSESSLVLRLLGTMKFDGVEFNNIAAGGLQLSAAGAQAGWKNVTYGKGNGGKPEELFSVGIAGKAGKKASAE